MNRIVAVRRLLGQLNAGAILVTSLPHVRWLSGFTGSAAVLFIDGENLRLVTDGRYRTQAVDEARDFEIHICDSDPIAYLLQSPWLDRPGRGRLLVQGDEMTVDTFRRLQAGAPGVNVDPGTELLDRLVACKDEDEIEAIRMAQKITDAVFEDIVGWLRPGVSEKAVAAEIVCRHLDRGAERMSFEPIVASGPNGGLPHARPGERLLAPGDLVVLDFGCVWNGYTSDMTRTVAISGCSDEDRAVYEVVREAQRRAVEAARAGIISRVLDTVARDYIAESGYGEYFTHSLGHGVGLRVHEWPRVSSLCTYPLPAQAAITIEPGIYVPGKHGVRIEDVVVLSHDGCVNLTASTHELIVC